LAWDPRRGGQGGSSPLNFSPKRNELAGKVGWVEAGGVGARAFGLLGPVRSDRAFVFWHGS